MSFQALFILNLIHIFIQNDRPFFISDYFFFLSFVEIDTSGNERFLPQLEVSDE